MIPRCKPRVTACVRSRAPSFWKTLSRCAITVSGERPMARAISLLLKPRATYSEHLALAGAEVFARRELGEPRRDGRWDDPLPGGADHVDQLPHQRVEVPARLG